MTDDDKRKELGVYIGRAVRNTCRSSSRVEREIGMESCGWRALPGLMKNANFIYFSSPFQRERGGKCQNAVGIAPPMATWAKHYQVASWFRDGGPGRLAVATSVGAPRAIIEGVVIK
jgi:hypothetical protein